MNAVIKEVTKQSFFKDKQHYLEFRAAWSQAVNSPNAKSKLVKVSCERRTDNGFYETIPDGSVMRVYGWIRGVHHLLFNLLRGKDPMYGFTPVTNKSKLEHGMNPNRGFNQAVSDLKSIIWQVEHAMSVYKDVKESENRFGIKRREFKNKDEEFNFRFDGVRKFVAPFGNTITPEMLLKFKEILSKEVK